MNFVVYTFTARMPESVVDAGCLRVMRLVVE